MLMLNKAGRTLKVVGLGVEVEPGETVEVEDGYCRPLRAPNGSRITSIIEKLAPGLVPADEDVRKEWEKVPETNVTPGPPKPTRADLVAQGVAPGVASIMAAKANATETKAKKVATAAKKTKSKPVSAPPPEDEPEAAPTPVKPPPAPKKRGGPGGSKGKK